MSCPANETHNPCGDSCEPKCADLYEYERRPCTRECYPPGGACVCERGFYRNKEKQCVSEEDCQTDFMEFITFEPS
ncbi:hypothetical protein Y032_0112g301 [Ancylostoma ceylanicum]|uniref:TIL domain-containing protein n=1 Tax=Ancylostoma ceylanicum TaxID=53326 RepID=A0A016TDT8_9BILA|nr:hypothetical protein Y032_0112g301 [Ancylostoma ceylanicum]